MNASKAEPVERLLTIAQAAELTNYGEDMILHWLARGLPFIAAGAGKKRPRKKDIRIRASALWQWIADLEVRKVPPPDRKRSTPSSSTPRPPASGGRKSLSAWREAKNTN